MMNQNEIRMYKFDVRAEQNEEHGHYIVGRPIVYGSPANIGGLFTEIIERGALDETDLKDVRFLINHDTSMVPLARSRNNNENSTMQMIVDDEGMEIRVDLDVENNEDARKLYSAVKRGDMDGMSFAFNIKKGTDEWENVRSEKPTRHVRKISKVTEVSAVTFPAYEATQISARHNIALDSAKATLDSVRSQSLDSEVGDVELIKAKLLALY